MSRISFVHTTCCRVVVAFSVQLAYLTDEFIDALTYKQAKAWTTGLDNTIRGNASLADRKDFMKSFRDLAQRTIHRYKTGFPRM